MRTVENYELVLSGEQEDRLMLTFDCADLPNIPPNVSSVSFAPHRADITVTFEDAEHWEEVRFINLPATLHALVGKFKSITIVGLSDKVELMSETTLVVTDAVP